MKTISTLLLMAACALVFGGCAKEEPAPAYHSTGTTTTGYSK
jgi:PBP1b-binding outer membrane lipoprotein LpoB